MKGDQVEINIYADNTKHYQNLKGDQVEINIYPDNQRLSKFER